MSGSQLRNAAAAFVLVLGGVGACGSEDGQPCELTRSCPRPLTECDTAKPPSGYEGLCVANHFRTYVMHLPSPMPAGKLPLIVTLHAGGPGAGLGQPIYIPAALDSGFAVVAPEGTMVQGDAPASIVGRKIWSAGGGFDIWTGGKDDVAFISALIDTLARRYPIDRARVFATGCSMASSMAYRLAHELSAQIAGIGALDGQEIAMSYPEPARTVAVMHMHSLGDTHIPYVGGLQPVLGINFKSVQATIAEWRARNGCPAQPDTVLNDPARTLLGLHWQCASGRGDVVLYTNPGDVNCVGQAASFIGFFKSLPARAP